MDYSGRCNLIIYESLKVENSRGSIVSQSKKDRRVAGFENEGERPSIQLS